MESRHQINAGVQPTHLRGRVRRRAGFLAPLHIACIVLAAGLVISFALWRHAEGNQARETRAHFDASSGLALAGIQRRMDELQTLLLGMQGLFIASEHVDRKQFQRYYNNLRGQLRLPGIRAMHFTRKVPDSEKDAFVAAVRHDRSLGAKGFPDFAIHPESAVAEHFIIEYIEPFDENQRAFGLDAISQAVNRESFLAARDSGKTSVTQPFQLVQTVQGERGMVLRAPVYRFGAQLGSVAERRSAFVGLVGISLKANDIFNDIFQESFLDGICILVRDVMPGGSGRNPTPVMQPISERCPGEATDGDRSSGLSSSTMIPVGERLWEVRLSASGHWLDQQQGKQTQGLILIAGIVISLLLAALYLALARSRTRAKQLAAQMTLSLRQSEQRFRAMAAMSTDWFWEDDTESRFVTISGAGNDDGSGRKLPLPLDVIKGKRRWEVSPSALTPEQWEAHRRQIRAREAFELEYPIGDVDGQQHWLHVCGAPRYDDAGVFLGYQGTAHDVTVRKLAEVEMARKTTVLQATLDNMSQGISVVDGDLNIIAFNRKFCEILDFPLDMGHEGASFESFIRYNAERGEYGPCDVDAKVADMLERARAMQPHRFKRTRPNGRIIEVVGSPVPGGGFVTTYTDITEQELAEQVIRVSEARLKRAELASGSGNWEFRVDSQVMIASEGAAKLYGIDSGRFEYPVVQAIPLPEYRPLLDAAMKGLIEVDRPYDVEFKIRKADTGETRDIHSIAQFDREEGVVFGVIQDVTDRKRAEETLQLAASVFTHAREGIMITNAEGIIVEVNDAFSHITGYSREEALGQTPNILSSGRSTPNSYTETWQALGEQGHWHGEVWNRRKNGEAYAELLTVSAVRDASGRTTNYVALFSDITPMKEQQQQLEHIAHYDALTNLPNRVLLADRLQQAMAQSQRRNQSLAVVYLDLDGFKPINDLHGHGVGDELLIALAQRMKAALREGDTMARLGGDEFVAVLSDLDAAKDCEPVLARLLQAASDPVTAGGVVLRVSASIGVTFYPQDPVDADLLLRHADQAMYLAKQTGKNRYHLFDIAQDAAVATRHESLERIRRALDQREFVVHYQPKVNMRTGAVIGAEALIRWQHPEHGLLPPADFLPIIENHPISIELGEWVIDTVLLQMSAWRAAGLAMPVSVNIGARLLQRENFVSRLAGLLAAHPDIDAQFLELEVLETSALEDITHVSEVMHACRALGVQFSLDDFGTGYSSLTYLKRLPAESLKIDQSFVRNMRDDPDDMAIVEGIIGLAAAFHRRIIAEGVETVAHGELLLQLGCELAQGHGIAQAMPPGELPGWVATWRPDAAWTAERGSP